MSRDGGQEDRGRNGISVEGSKAAELNIEKYEELLPGISNDITLNLIATKLPWTAFYVLSSVSHGWRRAIKGHQVYNARVRSKSLQTLVALDHESQYNKSTIGLYDLEDGSCRHFPEIPDSPGGIPKSCECIFLDGRLYVLGGLKDSRFSNALARADVYVLDVAGQRQWERCASMKHPRKHFGCGVNDGKIYVFGGNSESKPVCESEVYDPKEDAWSPISSSKCFRFRHDVTTVGKELYLYNGMFFDSALDYDDFRFTFWTPASHFQDACSADVYHPLKNEWRILEQFTGSSEDRLLRVGEKLLRLNRGGPIEVYDSLANSWGPLQPVSFESSRFVMHSIINAVAVDGEILAMVYWSVKDLRDLDDSDEEYEPDKQYEDEEYDEDGEYKDKDDGACLVRSQGVSGKEAGIVWKKLKFPFYLGDYSFLLSPIQL